MKIFLSLFFLPFSIHVFAQVNSVMPNEATVFYNNAMEVIKPGIKNCIEKNANKLKGRNVNVDSLKFMLSKQASLKNSTAVDLEALILLIMVQISKNADRDLKELVTNRKLVSESNESDHLGKRIQMILTNKSHLAGCISIRIKILDGIQQTIIDQFK